MEKILNDIIEKFKLKGIIISISKETNKSITLFIKTNINDEQIVEDLEILKSFITEEHIDVIQNEIKYLVHNSLSRYLGGV